MLRGSREIMRLSRFFVAKNYKPLIETIVVRKRRTKDEKFR